MSVRYYDWIAHHSRRSPNKLALVDLGSGRGVLGSGNQCAHGQLRVSKR